MSTDSDATANVLYGTTATNTKPGIADGFASQLTPQQEAALNVLYDGNSATPPRSMLESAIDRRRGELLDAGIAAADVQQTRADFDGIASTGLPEFLVMQIADRHISHQIADARASIARFRQAIAEQELQIAQLSNDRMAEVTKDLREVHARLVEVLPRRTNAEAVLGRMEIRSPYAGKVVGLTMFSLGGVIQRGEKIMDIVPDDDGLTIEAQVAVEDISDVRPGMRADIHLTAYKQRIVPTLHGEVTQVSADRLNDPKTGAPFYVATVKPDMAEVARLGEGVRLHPGMPATVMLPTDSRTAFDYIVGPLAASFRQSFKQK